MSASNNITQKVQLAISTWLKTQNIGDIPTANVFKGIERSDRALPCIVAECTTADHSPNSGSSGPTGNWRAHGSVKVRTQADNEDDETGHLARAGTVLDLFLTNTIEADLSSAIPFFTCFQFIVLTQSYTIVDNKSWVSFIEFDCECCGSVVS